MQKQLVSCSTELHHILLIEELVHKGHYQMKRDSYLKKTFPGSTIVKPHSSLFLLCSVQSFSPYRITSRHTIHSNVPFYRLITKSRIRRTKASPLSIPCSAPSSSPSPTPPPSRSAPQRRPTKRPTARPSLPAAAPSDPSTSMARNVSLAR